MKTTNQMAKGYKCDGCGKWNPFTAYVFAHWDLELIHTCECGAKYELLAGLATPLIECNEVGRNW